MFSVSSFVPVRANDDACEYEYEESDDDASTSFAVEVKRVYGDASPPAPLGCLLSEDEKAAGRAAMAAALRASDEANLCTQLHGAKGMERDVRLAWAALRDVVGIGREHRYSDDQITYHYTKDKALLMRAVEAHAAA